MGQIDDGEKAESAVQTVKPDTTEQEMGWDGEVTNAGILHAVGTECGTDAWTGDAQCQTTATAVLCLA